MNSAPQPEPTKKATTPTTTNGSKPPSFTFGSAPSNEGFKPNRKGTFGLGGDSPLTPESPPKPSSSKPTTPSSATSTSTNGTFVANEDQLSDDIGLNKDEFSSDARRKQYTDSDHQSWDSRETHFWVHLRGLNASFLRDVMQMQKKDPFDDFAVLFKAYRDHRKKIIADMVTWQRENGIEADEDVDGFDVGGAEEDNEEYNEYEGEAQDAKMQDANAPDAASKEEAMVEEEKTPPATTKSSRPPSAMPTAPAGGFSFGGKVMSFGSTTSSGGGGFKPTGFTPTPFVPPADKPASTAGGFKPSTGGFTPSGLSGGFTPSFSSTTSKDAEKTSAPSTAPAAPTPAAPSNPFSSFAAPATTSTSSGFSFGKPKSDAPAASSNPPATTSFASFGAPASDPFKATLAGSSSGFNFGSSAATTTAPKPVDSSNAPGVPGTTGTPFTSFAFPPPKAVSPVKWPATEPSPSADDNDKKEGETTPKASAKPLQPPVAPISNSPFGIANPWAVKNGTAPAPAADSPFKFGMGAKPPASSSSEATKAPFSFADPPATTKAASASFSFAEPPKSASSGFSFGSPSKSGGAAAPNPFTSPPKVSAPFSFSSTLGSGATPANSTTSTSGSSLFGGTGTSGSTSSGFSFAAPSKPTAGGTGFSFGAPTSSGATSTTGGFSFGAPPTFGSSTFAKTPSFGSTISTDTKGTAGSNETVSVPGGGLTPSGGSDASLATDATVSATVGTSQESDVAPEVGTGLALGEDKFDQPGPGEENEESLFTVRGKVMRFSGSSWADLGIGQIRLYKHKETGAKRIFARNSKSGRIILNFAPFAKMEPKIDDTKAKFMRMTATDNGKLVKILIKLKEESEAAEFVAVLQKEVDALS